MTYNFKTRMISQICALAGGAIFFLAGCKQDARTEASLAPPDFKLIPADTFYFNSFVDCNMAEAWVGDPSAVACGDYLYLFYGEYGYPGIYEESIWNSEFEWGGQCISVARIRLRDLDNPAGKAQRWNGKGFNEPHDGIGVPIASLQIPIAEGGGPASSPTGGFHWGPSVSWNTYLDCWVMLMGKVTGPSWAGSSIYISFNRNKELGDGSESQEWSKPQLLLDKPGYFLWYPSLQPMNTPEDISNRHTCLKLGQRARLFVKNIRPDKSEYKSEHIIEFYKTGS